jgi:hypothetical protein
VDEKRDYQLHTGGVAMEGASGWGIIFVQVKGLAPQASLLCLNLGCAWSALVGVQARIDLYPMI